MKLPYFDLLLFGEEAETTEVVDNTVDNVDNSEQETPPEWLGQIGAKFDKDDYVPTSKDEVKELVEMGLFYREKGKAKLEGYKSEQAKLDFINAELEKQGYSPDTFDKWQEDIQKVNKQEQVNQLMAQKGLSEEDAVEYLEGKTAKEQLNAITAKENETKAAEKAREQQISSFFSEYSDLKTEDLSKEVLEAFDKGVPLKEAYLKEQNIKMSERIAEIEKVKTNGRNPGSAAGVQQGKSVDISKMTSAEFKKYKRERFNKG